MTYLSCPDAPAAKEYATVYVAWELSKADWKLGRLLAEYQLPTCGSVLTSIDLELIGFQPSQSRFIQGLRMCRHVHGDGGYELKGLGVVAGEVTAGSVTVTPRTSEEHSFRRANCPDHPVEGSLPSFPFSPGHSIEDSSGWTDWDQCWDQKRELAVGVSVYIHGKYFSGMAVRCKAVTAVTAPTPVKDASGY